MNPHFIFNSLNSIQSFILNNDRLLSQNYLSNFATLIRKILSNSQKSTISLNDELGALKHYLELEKLRFNEKFTWELFIEHSIDLEQIKVPPLILQPFIENALWHGVMPLNRNSVIKISIVTIDHEILCTIEDNGIGREAAKTNAIKKNKTHESLGTHITQNRVNLFNLYYKTNMRIEFVDLFDKYNNPNGTQVKIYNPIILPNN